MTEAELQAMLDQYPGWVAIERLVAHIRALEAELARLRAQGTRLMHGDHGA